jgi:glyoxylase-like metal-dependent hydrolase (beta-lactamase superfamily II)
VTSEIWPTPRRAYAEARGIVETIMAAAATATIDVKKLRNNVSVLAGSGGNVAVLTGKDGKVLIDAGIGASHMRMAEALASLGADPLTHLINTHWHFDHSDGNAWLHEAGVTILVHENTRKHLLSAHRVDDWDYDFPALPSGAVPTKTLSGDQPLRFNGTDLALRSYAPAHTDGDISVTFVEADILHTGDTWWNGIYPFIDYSTGGSIDGMIKAADVDLAMTTKDTIIIPGHGAVGNRTELQEYRDMLLACREAIAALKKKGLTGAETAAAKPTAPFDAKWGQFVIGPELFTKLIYEGV